MQVFHGFDHARRRAALCARLANLVVFAGRLDTPSPFAHVVADGFFDVDVFTGLHGPDGGQRVPMIRRGDRHHVDRRIGKGLAHVVREVRLRPCFLAASATAVCAAIFVGVDDPQNFGAGSLAERQMAMSPPPPAPMIAMPSFSLASVVRRRCFLGHARPAACSSHRRRRRRGRKHRLLQKLSARVLGHARLHEWGRGRCVGRKGRSRDFTFRARADGSA